MWVGVPNTLHPKGNKRARFQPTSPPIAKDNANHVQLVGLNAVLGFGWAGGGEIASPAGSKLLLGSLSFGHSSRRTSDDGCAVGREFCAKLLGDCAGEEVRVSFVLECMDALMYVAKGRWRTSSVATQN